MRIAVAGVTGFLGGHIIDELARHDVEIVGLVRPGADASRLTGLDLSLVEADVTDPESLGPTLAGADFVINAVRLTTPGLSDTAYDDVNVGGATNLLDASLAAGVRGFIQLSSTAMYGDSLPHWPVDESWAFRPLSSLDQSRAMAERAARTYRRRIGLVVLRPSLAFGPRDHGPMRRLLLHFIDQPRLRLIGGGRAPVSLVYAPDLARAVWGVIDALEETEGRIFHLSSIDTDWRTLAEELYALLHRRPRFASLPYRLALAASRLGRRGEWLLRPPDGVQRYVTLTGRPRLIDDSRLRAATGFAPLYGLRSALRQTLEALAEERSDLRPS